MNIQTKIFKSYDIRGIYPIDINEEIVYKIAQAYTKLFQPRTVIVGRDVRESGPALFEAAVKGFTDAGVHVIDIGIVSTDTFYFAVGELPVDGGVTLSASHNPREWNGMNFCKKNAEPVSLDTGLAQIRDMLLNDEELPMSSQKGNVERKDVVEDFLKRVVEFVDYKSIKPTKLVANGNFGVDVQLLRKAVEMYSLPIEIIPINDTPDGTFPKGHPNPLLPENRKELLDLIKEHNADMGVSWDADGDRCFFADENAQFIEGYYMTALLATEVLKKHPGSKILIDPRLTWASLEAIKEAGGTPIVTKAGMTLIAARMKTEGATFAGEMSSHFYFKENYNRDNGLIPLFLILEMMSKYNKKLSELVYPYTSRYFSPGEINFETENKDAIIEAAKQTYSDGKQEFIDGISVEYDQWRFNLRKSNTEPLLRLNLEAKSQEEMEKRKNELITFIKERS